jgi:nitrate reductase NapE component
MGEEEKNSSPNIEAIEAPAEDRPEEQHTAVETSHENEAAQAQVVLNHKRGRMITAGLVTVVIVSLIAVLVAGMFQFGLWWLKPCPTDLPVNDPSPKLWQEMVSQKVSIQGLGVPEKVRAETQFKKSATVPKESGNDPEAKEGK